ncbi:hypothetical protein [Legionella sp. km772]|uniref:hypothetical protein n=1 Tax=Legionella sp. km772 TaxID=2498111 RepID=UPI000F8C43D2|nr:hypothetical protein [Legionella sp. km772]RUR11133.1 hypothetical protein ELY15_07415 [Legionella sp. km772]
MPISLNLDDSQFFIAIAKKQAHSFVMLGSYKDNKVQQLLCRVGKFFDLGESDNSLGEACSVFGALTGAAFSSTAAKIKDEGITRKQRGHQAITYQAYDISFRQYVEFIQMLETLQEPKNSFHCYKPVSQRNNSILLESTKDKLFKTRPLSGPLFSAVNHLSINNNCRHGAIKLVEEVLHHPISSMVSTHFFSNLPYKTFLDFGVPSRDLPFYVLPPPPNTYTSVKKEKRQVLERLYERMEHMLLLEPSSDDTQKKFSCVKDFYNQQVAAEVQEPSIERLLVNIRIWKKEHYQVLNTLRKTYFWDEFITRKSATLTIIEEIEEDLLASESSADLQKNSYCASTFFG